MPESRKSFAPLVLLGLASSALAAVAANQRMMGLPSDALVEQGISETMLDRIQGDGVQGPALTGGAADVVTGDLPLAGALALVLLALWGVLLVTRGRVRLVVAWLTTLASAGIAAALVIGQLTGQDGYRDSTLRALGLPPSAEIRDGLAVEPTGWFWVACVAAVLALAVCLASLKHVRHWPAMGSRYDAPGAAQATDRVDPETASGTDLWKAMDEGHDPTA